MELLIIILTGPLMQNEPDHLFGELSKPEEPPKRKKAGSTQVFKQYQQHQLMMLPPNLEELIPQAHVVRVVNRIVDGLRTKVLLDTYQGGGASAYHPVMLLKVLIYAYVSKVYASRLIAKALRENINFMWLSGMSRPDFRTINDFRSGRLKSVIDEVFSSTVLFLIEEKYIDLSEYFVDGTKLRADSNRHKVVWAKKTKRYKEMVQEKIRAELKVIDQVNQHENERYGDRDLEELGDQSQLRSERVKEHVAKLNATVQGGKQQKPSGSGDGGGSTPEANNQTAQQTRKAINEIETKLLPKLERYEDQEEILAGRNSYSRTDNGATVFRMKDGQLLPAYNVLLGTERQFIINYSLHQKKASEADAFIAHMEHGMKLMRRYPSSVMGDSAYGSEENYAFLAKEQIGNYLKYNTFHFEWSKKHLRNAYRKEKFIYDATTDTYSCPQGRTLHLLEAREAKTDNRYTTHVRIYQSADCGGCAVADLCKRGAGNRTIQINRTLDVYRAQARANLISERGIALRKERGVDVESSIGDIKFNQGYNRCRLRGEAKVNVELGLLSIAHNMKKVARLSIN